MGVCSRAAAVLAAAALIPAAAVAQTQPLYVLDLKVTAEPAPELGRRPFSAAPADLARRLTGVVSLAADHVVLDASKQAVQSRGAPPPPQATFVIDYGAEPGAALHTALVAKDGMAPRDEDLIAVVRATIEPSDGRSFDIASPVARLKKGGCPHDAGLPAALARSVGLPAKVAIGTLIAREGDQIGAFGHAWTEIYRDRAWHLVDATPLEGAERVAYVPEGLLEDEGPGYGFGLLSLLSTGILRVEVIGNAP